MKTKKQNSINDFLINDDFINYILNPTPSLVLFWSNFLSNNPQFKAIAYEAEQVLLGEGDCIEMDLLEKEELKARIIGALDCNSI